MRDKGRLPADDAERFVEELTHWIAFLGKHIHSISPLQVHVKGRLPTDDAQRFFEELTYWKAFLGKAYPQHIFVAGACEGAPAH